MKRSICFLLLLAVMFSALSVTCFAQAPGEETVVAYFEDGSYITESIEASFARASGTVTGARTKNYYGSDGSLKWKAVLTGKFTYNGTSATCTSASMDVTISDSTWYVISKSASKSGNTAYGTATVGEKTLGSTVNKVPVSLSLSCDKDGNLS